MDRNATQEKPEVADDPTEKKGKDKSDQQRIDEKSRYSLFSTQYPVLSLFVGGST